MLSSLHIAGTGLVTGLEVEDTVILHPVQPASGLSACPGQDVTRGDQILYNDQFASSDFYTLVSHVVGLTVMSNATINSVQLSDHDRIITCRSLGKISTKNITIAGNYIIILCAHRITCR